MVGELSSVVEASKPEFVKESDVSSDIISDPCNDGTAFLEVKNGSRASRDGAVTLLRSNEVAESDDSIPSGSDPHSRESVSSEQRGATSCCTSCDVTVDATRTSDNGVATSEIHAAIDAHRRNGNEDLTNRRTEETHDEARLLDRSSHVRCSHASCSTDHTPSTASTHVRSTHDGSTVGLNVQFADQWAQSLGVAFGAVISEVESHMLTSQKPIPIDKLSQMIEASLSELVFSFGTQVGSAENAARSTSGGGVVTAGTDGEAATLCASAICAAGAAAGATVGVAVAVKHAPLPHAFLSAALSTFRTCARVRRALARTVPNQAVPSQALPNQSAAAASTIAVSNAAPIPAVAPAPAATPAAAAPASAPSAPGSGWRLGRHGHGCSRGTTGGFEGEGSRKGELGKEAGAGAGEVAVGEEGAEEEGVEDEVVGEEGMREEEEHGAGVLSSLISSYDPMAAVLLQSEVAARVEGHTDEQKEKGERKEKREQKDKGEQREKRERKKGLDKENGGEEEERGMTGECKAGRGMKTGGSTGKQEQSRKHKEKSARKSRREEPRRLQEQTKKQQHWQQQMQQDTHAPAHSSRDGTPEGRSPPSHAYQSVSPFYALVFEAPQKQSSRTPESHAPPSDACHSDSPPHTPQLHSPEPQSPIPAIPTLTAPTPSLLALRYVTALEERNRLSAAKLSQSALSVSLHAQHLAATDRSNHLMAQKVELSKGEKARREQEGQERRGREELAGFARACADELVAGLLVMLVVIGMTGWRFAGERLAAGVAACQVRHDPALDASSFLGVSFSRPDRSLVTWLRLIGCKLTVAGQMLLAGG
ncbi:unnamed protein product [Closterium sp. NIES-54]